MSLCGAETGSGAPCRRRVAAGGRCPSHADVAGREGAPAPPGGLSEAAEALWWSVVAGEGEDHPGYELEGHEMALLTEACRIRTRLDGLEEVLRSEGLTAYGSKGQPVVHPALSEARAQELAFARLLAQLRFPQGDAEERRSTATRSGRPQRRGGSRGLYV